MRFLHHRNRNSLKNYLTLILILFKTLIILGGGSFITTTPLDNRVNLTANEARALLNARNAPNGNIYSFDTYTLFERRSVRAPSSGYPAHSFSVERVK